MKKILWIAGRFPSPLFSGDALYSAGMLTALSRTERATVTVVGTRRENRPIEDRLLRLPRTAFTEAPWPRRFGLLSLLTPLPRDAYSLAPPSIGAALAELLDQHWDWIVFDHARSAAFLPTVLQRQKRASICYVAHNAEGKIRPEIAKDFANPLRRSIAAGMPKSIDWATHRRRHRLHSLHHRGGRDLLRRRQYLHGTAIYLGTIAPSIASNRPGQSICHSARSNRSQSGNPSTCYTLLQTKQNVTLDVVGNVRRTSRPFSP